MSYNKEIRHLINKGETEMASKMLQPLVNIGNSEAIYLSGSFSLPNESEENFNNRHLLLTQKAANLGHAEASYTIGMYHDTGMYFKKDMNRASLYFKKAALSGHARAQVELWAGFILRE